MYGIIGYGTVGKALATCLTRNSHDWWAYDADPKVIIHNSTGFLGVSIEETPVVYVCVPTPVGENGYDLTAVQETFTWLTENRFKGTIILCSTIGLGDYKILNARLELIAGEAKPLNLVVKPEFCREKRAVEDMYYAPYSIFGHHETKKLRPEVMDALMAPHAKTTTVEFYPPDVCALIKTGRNLALAMKLMVASVIHEEGKAHRIGQHTLNEALDFIFEEDDRLATKDNYHSVGRHPYSPGVGGRCLPKDMAAKSHSPKLPSEVRDMLASVLRVNELFRS